MASGTQIAKFAPGHNQPPATNPAIPDWRNGHPRLTFDQTTGEIAIFSDVLSRAYAGGGITVNVKWACAVNTGTVGWLVAIEKVASTQDTDADNFGADATITATTVSGTSGIELTTSVNISNANFGIAVGERYRIRLTRDVANDTAAGDAEFTAMEILEQ